MAVSQSLPFFLTVLRRFLMNLAAFRLCFPVGSFFRQWASCVKVRRSIMLSMDMAKYLSFSSRLRAHLDEIERRLSILCHCSTLWMDMTEEPR